MRAKPLPRLTDEQARLAEQFVPLASRQAWREHRRTGIDADELSSVALFQLCRIAAWWNPARGIPFAPIATRLIAQKLRQSSALRLAHPEIAFSALDGDSDRDAAITQVPDSSPDLADLESGQVLAAARKQLGALDYAVVHLLYVEQLEQKEIAQRLGVSRSAIGQRLDRILLRLSRSRALRRLAEVSCA